MALTEHDTHNAHPEHRVLVKRRIIKWEHNRFALKRKYYRQDKDKCTQMNLELLETANRKSSLYPHTSTGITIQGICPSSNSSGLCCWWLFLRNTKVVQLPRLQECKYQNSESRSMELAVLLTSWCLLWISNACSPRTKKEGEILPKWGKMYDSRR